MKEMNNPYYSMLQRRPYLTPCNVQQSSVNNNRQYNPPEQVPGYDILQSDSHQYTEPDIDLILRGYDLNYTLPQQRIATHLTPHNLQQTHMDNNEPYLQPLPYVYNNNENIQLQQYTEPNVQYPIQNTNEPERYILLCPNQTYVSPHTTQDIPPQQYTQYKEQYPNQNNNLQYDQSQQLHQGSSSLYSSTNETSTSARRKSRTLITAQQKEALISMYVVKQHLSKEELQKLSEDVGLSVKVVHNWFKNRRKTINNEHVTILTKYFHQNSNPNDELITKIATETHLSKEVVKNWFVTKLTKKNTKRQ